jgi:hypothetical protein
MDDLLKLANRRIQVALPPLSRGLARFAVTTGTIR